MTRDEFICEPLTPVAGTGDTIAMSKAEPGVPERFFWRGGEWRTLGIIRRWKTSSRERGGTEIYLRRHWHEILAQPAAGGETRQMTIYCDRRAKNRQKPKQRWFVYTIRAEEMLNDNT